MRSPADRVQAEKYENNRFAYKTQVLENEFDGGARLLVDILLGVASKRYRAEHRAHDPGPVEEVGDDVSEIAHAEDEYRLYGRHVTTESGHNRSQNAGNDPNRERAETHREKRSDAEPDVGARYARLVDERLKDAIQHDRYRVVENRFAENEYVQDFVHVYLLENGENGDGIDGGRETGEEKRFDESEFFHAGHPTPRADSVERGAERESVPQRPNDCIE